MTAPLATVPAGAVETLTIDQWLVERDKVVGQVKRLVHLWFVNKLGSQRELAKQLQVSTGTITHHVKTLRSTGDLTEEMCPRNKQNSANRANFVRPVENSTPTFNSPTPVTTNDQQQVRLLQSPEDPSPVVEPEVMPTVQMGGSSVDIRSFTPTLEKLLFGIESARRNSANTAEQWGCLEAMLQTLYHHAQCERRQRERAEHPSH